LADSIPRFSQRSGMDRDPNRASERLAAHLAAGKTLRDLSSGNPAKVGLSLGELSLSPLSNRAVLEYEPEAFGPLWAREVLSREFPEHGPAIPPDRIVITASTSEAYSFLLKLLCDPGDEVLVPAPSYPLLEHLSRFESVVTRPYRLAYDGAWHIDFESIVCSSRTRAILVVNPNNPTGNFLTKDELDRLARYGLPIISDEVFASYPLELGPGRARSALEHPDALVFALSGLSKLVALPQMKIAWIAVSGPEQARTEALGRLELIADAFLSPSAPSLQGLPTWLRARPTIQGLIHGRLIRNLGTLTRAVKNSPITRLPVEGGWYAPLRLPATKSDEEWALELLENTGALVHPGYFFDFDGPPHIVVSLITPEQELTEAAPLLVDYVASR
jgi:alanine-synthesizing transaminase